MKDYYSKLIVDDAKDIFSQLLERGKDFPGGNGDYVIYVGGCIASMAALLLASLDEEADERFIEQIRVLKQYFQNEREMLEVGGN
jgi:hypothetical protein